MLCAAFSGSDERRRDDQWERVTDEEDHLTGNEGRRMRERVCILESETRTKSVPFL